AFVALFAVYAVCPALPARVTHADETAAEKAAREIADARDAVATAASAYQNANQRIEHLSEQQVQLQTQVDALQGQVGTLQQEVQQVAVNRFTRSSAEGSPILNGFNTPEDQMQVDALSQVIWDASDNAFDEYDSLNRDLVQKQRSLQQSQQRTEQQVKDLAALQVTAAAKVKQLQQVEAQRLKDEAVRVALEKEQARRAAKATILAEAAARSQGSNPANNAPSTKGSGGTTTVKNQTVSNGSGGSVNLGGGDSGQAVRFGNGIGYPYAPFGSGGRPTTTGIDWSGSDWVCPTGRASVGFSDSFIVPGTPGRQHNGIDIFGHQGTPLLATVDGNAQAVVQDMGGMDVFLFGNNGDFYFYAHLEAWGKMGPVKKGTIIGYMGMTGNAGGYHLHFEWHPGGVGNPQDPIQKLRSHC
ncbi:MAG: peptidoglycan DD-metalloendopeptidase family protein, partial [Actinomycetota bacterium]